MASSVPSDIDWRRVLLIAAHTNYNNNLTYDIYVHDLIFYHKQLHIIYIIYKLFTKFSWKFLVLNFQVIPSWSSSYSARPLVIYQDAATSLARMQQRPSLPHPYIPVYSMLQLRRRRLHPVEWGGRQPMAGRPEVPLSPFNRPLCNTMKTQIKASSVTGHVRCTSETKISQGLYLDYLEPSLTSVGYQELPSAEEENKYWY